MNNTEKIEKLIKDLFKDLFDIDISLNSNITLKGLEVVIDCDTKEKGKILGKNGRTMRVIRFLIRNLVRYFYGANISIYLKPDIEYVSKQSSNTKTI
jgi:predicted RNA-binding protein YlqC (UPF0109 family)